MKQPFCLTFSMGFYFYRHVQRFVEKPVVQVHLVHASSVVKGDILPVNAWVMLKWDLLIHLVLVCTSPLYGFYSPCKIFVFLISIKASAISTFCRLTRGVGTFQPQLCEFTEKRMATQNSNLFLLILARFVKGRKPEMKEKVLRHHKNQNGKVAGYWRILETLLHPKNQNTEVAG